MPNLVIFKKGSEDILYFVQNAILKKNNVYGDNKKLLGLRMNNLDFVWTNQELTWTEEDKSVSYKEKRSEIVSIEQTSVIASLNKQDIKNLMDIVYKKEMLTKEELDFVLKTIGLFLLNVIEIK